jgi:hypothetical protein
VFSSGVSPSDLSFCCGDEDDVGASFNELTDGDLGAADDVGVLGGPDDEVGDRGRPPLFSCESSESECELEAD